MDFNNYITLKTLPVTLTNGKEKILHLPYKDEVRLFNIIHNGDTQSLMNIIKLSKTIPVGSLSDNNVKQTRYLAVCFITLAVRYAVSGGMNEDEAYSFSDYFIRQIDTLKTSEEIINRMALGAIELTNSVRESRINVKYPPYVRKCIQYINDNLDKKITVSVLAELCGVSCDYLSSVFKKDYGENLSEYIMNRKLDAARNMLIDGMKQSDICYTLAFSSQSHFINAFKKKYGVTPGQYKLQL